MKNHLVLLAGFVFVMAFSTNAQVIDGSKASPTVIVWEIDGSVMYKCPESDEPKTLHLGKEIDKNCTVTLFPGASLQLVDNQNNYKITDAGSYELNNFLQESEIEKGNLDNDYIDVWDSDYGFGGGGGGIQEGKSGWGKKAGCPTPALPDKSKVCACDNTFQWEKGDVKEPVKFEIFDGASKKVIFMAITKESQMEFDLSSLAVDAGKNYYWTVNPVSKEKSCSHKVTFEAVPGKAVNKVIAELETGEEYKKSNDFVKLIKKAKALENAGFRYAANDVYRKASMKYDNSLVEKMRIRNATPSGDK